METDKIVSQAQDMAASTADSLRAELEVIKAQVEHLLTKHVAPAITDAAGHAVANAKELADYQKKNVSTRVSSSPLLSVAISAVVGFLAGRFSR